MMDESEPHETGKTARAFAPIAIIGYGYRLPGGIDDDKSFYDLLAKREFVQEVVDQRYGKGEVPWDGFTDSPASIASPYEGLITEGRELEFDCSVFGVAKNDAKRMDPQMKMMLTATWDALQCAGLDQAALHNSNTGVFVGHQSSSIASWKPPMGGHPADVPGRSGAMIANRISYHFNWKGPSLSIATACSSGITALDMAIKSLHNGECDIVASGAVSYLGQIATSVGFNTLGIISKTGSSRSFDKDANGYMRSEGAFMYILKRMDDAERDGDKIFGVIRGCALNTAGAEPDADIMTQGRMIVAPVQAAQRELMTRVANMAGIDPSNLDYVEAHATGTEVGDAVEGNAIAEAYGKPNRRSPLRLSSARSNLGHMEAASFASSLLKVLIMLDKQEFLPISQHFKEPTEKIPFAEQCMRVQTEVEKFPENGHPVMIGINSFGFGGANGHCIIEQYEPVISQRSTSLESPEKVYVVPLSAKSDMALVENARRLAEQLEDVDESVVDMYTLTANLSVRMTHHRVRKALTATTLINLQEKLLAFSKSAEGGLDKADIPPYLSKKTGLNTVIVFPGQGSQWAGCGKELYETEIAFREIVDAVDEKWKSLSGHKLSTVVFDTANAELVHECAWAQPATFLLQVGMYEMLKVYGITPSAVIGHSAGEVVAAYASNAYSLEEACFVVYHRSRLQQTLAGCGRMLALMLDLDTIRGLLGKYNLTSGVEIACCNSPSNTVVCGSSEMIETLQGFLEKDDLPIGKLIPGNTAFHSRHMQPIENELLEVLGTLDRGDVRVCRIPMISTVTGMFQVVMNAEYWWENVRKPVNLLGALETANKQIQPDLFIELSPHITLRSSIRDFYGQFGESLPTYVFSVVRDKDSAQCLAETFGRCFEGGVDLDFKGLYPKPRPLTHLLPNYFMKRERVIDDLLDENALIRTEGRSAGPMLGKRIQGSCFAFQSVHGGRILPWMEDHKVQGKPIFPAAGYVELLLEALGGGPINILHADIVVPFELTATRWLRTELRPYSYAPDKFDFSIVSMTKTDSDSRTTHFAGVVTKICSSKFESLLPHNMPLSLEDEEGDSDFVTLYSSGDEIYSLMEARLDGSFSYGPHFQTMEKVYRNPLTQDVKIEISINSELWRKWDQMGYHFHPSLLDGVLQSYVICLMDSPDFSAVPKTINKFIFLCKPSSEKIVCILHPAKDHFLLQKGQPRPILGESFCGTVCIYDAVTRGMIAYLGEYYAFNTNDKRNDLNKLKHTLSWQPKDGENVDMIAESVISALSSGDSLESASFLLLDLLIQNGHPCKDTQFFVNVAECLIGSPPESLVLDKCLSMLKENAVQYTLLSSDDAYLLEKYKGIAVSNQDAKVRFFRNDAPTDMGFLRPAMFEVVFVRLNEADQVADPTSENEWLNMTNFVAPGGLVLVEAHHSFDMPRSWTCLWVSGTSNDIDSSADNPRLFFLQAGSLEEEQPHVDADHRQWVVVDDDEGFSEFWLQQMGRSSVPICSPINFEHSHLWTRVDYFAMLKEETAEDDPSLFVGAAKLTEFIQSFAAQRLQSKESVTCLFTVITSGAVGLGLADQKAISPSQTTIWGAVRSMVFELGESCKVDFRLVDVATKTDLKFVRNLEKMREREMCVYHGRALTSRLINIHEMMPSTLVRHVDKTFFRLCTNSSGALKDLGFRTYHPAPLGPNTIEVIVEAAALNFRDIMVSLAKLPQLSYERSSLGRTVGMECAGRVVGCGELVTDFQVNDEVIAMHGGCIGNRIRVHKASVFHKPKNLSMEEGSSVLSVYVTAYYALCYLARVRKGQSLLIHSGMGGVGQAAIGLAKLRGLNVYATAGTESKREALRSMGCVDAYDSHSESWYEDLMASTDGKGVDIILNSLAGKHIDLCLEALAPGGNLLEIGKMDILSDRPMKMAIFRKNLSYRAIDIDRLMLDDPKLSMNLTRTVLKLLRSKKVLPIPCTVFRYSEYMDAVSLMLKGRHLGKLVLIPNDTITVVDERRLFSDFQSSGAQTVLLSGCFGGFGMRVLSYVVSMGAKYILMLDRDKQGRRSARSLLELIGSPDVVLNIVQADVGVYNEVVDAIQSVERLGMPPISNLFHLAGVLDDKPCTEIDRESFERVFNPKANGAWNLHRTTLQCKCLERFVMISSTSSAFGNAGQVNYSAANSFQDGLAVRRRQMGLPALSFMMAALVDTGMAATSPELLRLMKAKGMPAISSIFAIEALDSALRSGRHSNMVAALSTGLVVDLSSSDCLRSSAQLIRNSAAFDIGAADEVSAEDLMQMIAERVGSLCGEQDLNYDEPFSSYGLNSISVAELIAFFKMELSHSVSAMELMTSATCRNIADRILSDREARRSGKAIAADEATTKLVEQLSTDDGSSPPLSLIQVSDVNRQDLVNLVLRPPRMSYQMAMLGPETFTYSDQRFLRSDFSVISELGNELMCSHWEPAERHLSKMPALIYLHRGNSARPEMMPHLSHFLSSGVTVFAFDFAGCGKSKGDYISQGHFEQEDLSSIVSYLRATGTVSEIVLWGRCLGAATALMYAARDPSIAAMVLDSPFSDLTLFAEEVVESARAKSAFLSTLLDTKSVVRIVDESIEKQLGFRLSDVSPLRCADRCHMPALFVAGEGDTIVGKYHTEALIEKYAGENDQILIDGDHFSPRPEFLLKKTTDFLRKCLWLPDDMAVDVSTDSDNSQTVEN